MRVIETKVEGGWRTYERALRKSNFEREKRGTAKAPGEDRTQRGR